MIPSNFKLHTHCTLPSYEVNYFLTAVAAVNSQVGKFQTSKSPQEMLAAKASDDKHLILNYSSSHAMEALEKPKAHDKKRELS